MNRAIEGLHDDRNSNRVIVRPKARVREYNYRERVRERERARAVYSRPLRTKVVDSTAGDDDRQSDGNSERNTATLFCQRISSACACVCPSRVFPLKSVKEPSLLHSHRLLSRPSVTEQSSAMHHAWMDASVRFLQVELESDTTSLYCTALDTVVGRSRHYANQSGTKMLSFRFQRADLLLKQKSSSFVHVKGDC